MKLALAQINPIVGNLEYNYKLHTEYILKALKNGAEIIVFPELSLIGYPPKDLLEKPIFVEKYFEYEKKLKKFSEDKDLYIIFGGIDKNKEKGKYLYNTAIVLYKGKIITKGYKILLPTYDVFDEIRYFERGKKPVTFNFKKYKIGISICEDVWSIEKYKIINCDFDPVKYLKEHQNIDFLINISASPYFENKEVIRKSLLKEQFKTHNVPIIYVNQVGGNDELIFDGNSLIIDKNGKIFSAGNFRENLFFVKFDDLKIENVYPTDVKEYTGIESILQALILGLKDYVRKCGFKKVVLGLSGGIDSALVATIAVFALGSENVFALSMPSEFSSKGSITDAQKLAKNLGISLKVIPIKKIFRAFLDALNPIFKDLPFNIAEENIQARIRGTLLMAISNKFGHLLITTGNKSELAMGYCTLYGDMAGGLAVIADVYKTKVYELANFINRDREIIPQSIINKPPSAELRPNQKDEDSLPPYPILDKILKAYIEEYKSFKEIVEMGFDEELVKNVLYTVDRNEYKRYQAPPCLKISVKSFGFGRRMPIAKGFVF